MIQAVLADDEVLARQKLRQLLRDERDIEIVGECASANETVELVRATKPALLFLDIRMPGMDGFDVIGALESEKNCRCRPLFSRPHMTNTRCGLSKSMRSTTSSNRSRRSGCARPSSASANVGRRCGGTRERT